MRVGIATVELLAISLVWYLLRRSKEDFGTIGLTKKRLGIDLITAVGLVVAIIIGLLFLVGILHGLGVTPIHKSVGKGVKRTWLPALYATSIRTAFVEEVFVTGYLLHRLRQLGWNDRKALATSVAVRTSYHVYGGILLGTFTVLFGILLGRIWQKTNRLTLIVATHALYDSVLFTLAVLAKE